MSTIVKRTISGAIYCAVLIFCLLWSKYSFLAFMLFALSVMVSEFLTMTMGKDYQPSQCITNIAGLLFFSMVWAVRAFTAISAEFCFLAIIPLMVLMVNSLYVKDRQEFGKFANTYTSLLYIAMPMSISNFLVMNNTGEFSGILLICFFVIIWCSDIGAYLFGISLGQKFGKKLFPSISPKKSWIGFWGGFLVAIIASLVLFYTGVWQIAGLSSFTWYHAVILAIIMNIAGVYGDLFESQWKRHYKIKDSGKIIPGHGGMLDRLDSAIFAIPIGTLYLAMFRYIELTF